MSDETKKKMSLASLGKKKSLAHRKSMSLSRIGKLRPKSHEYYCFRQFNKMNRRGAWRKGVPLIERYGEAKAKKLCENMSKKLKGRNCYWMRKPKSEETKRKLSLSNRGQKRSKEIIEANRISSLKYWYSLSEEKKQEHIIKVLNAQYPFPTSLEQHCINIFKENKIDLVFTGDGLYNNKKFAIGGCYPDFLNIKKKIVVEVYAVFHKLKQYGSVENYQTKRIKRMKNWKVLFFDEHIIYSNEKAMINEIKTAFKNQELIISKLVI